MKSANRLYEVQAILFAGKGTGNGSDYSIKAVFWI